MIIPYYKPYGHSSHLLAQKVGELLGEKATHTGTLDPAAEGVLIVLSGEDRFLKSKMSAATKVYTAEVLLGITTDTQDIIGIATEVTHRDIILSQQHLFQSIRKLEGTYAQTQPNFSAQRQAGTSHFELAKLGKELIKKQNTITIQSIEVKKISEISIKELREAHQKKLNQISGDFRQLIIASDWTKNLSEMEEREIVQLPLVTLRITCSRRTYIRALVRDLGELLELPTTLFSLVREQNGPYSIKDCLCLVPPSKMVANALEVSPSVNLANALEV